MPDHTVPQPAVEHTGNDPMKTETIIARLTHWFRQRPNSLEFWELILTDERLLFCFVGESYRSLLLRADMGERDRAAIADLPPDDIETFDERNFTVPLEAVEKLRLVTGTRLRRARLVVGWQAGDDVESDEWTLYQSRTADSQRELVTELESDPRLEDVDITVETPRFPRL
ncbi:hypothetical protein [Natrinema hispanicum]|uniref:Uncharacterized protein n=1 Tax=Natrinema hispanicum TaxID=392421 RepID=A0A1I0DBL7_9EURY|nr:hypothetical protein [Natrinema hispanicum]SDC87814.1 hypothetical protein SAMN05192552_1008139 [Natrinema hispanicum]SET29621.1 hypothetical protein SAMN04488694_10594 [Natrinema hispanicum]